MMTKFKAGQTIEWESQSAGIRKAKRGKVLAVIRGAASLLNSLDLLGKKYAKTRVKAQDRAVNDRYLIEVPRRGGRDGLRQMPSFFYAPLVSVLDGDSGSAGRLIAGAS